MFPFWRIDVLIPIIGLVGIGCWIYGRTTALSHLLLSLGYHFFISIYYFDIYDYYRSAPLGVFVCIIVIYLTGFFRANLDAIKATNEQLDRTVAERNAELDRLTRQLLERSEHHRVVRGQELHDEIGQQLTGIRLFCSAMAEQLSAEKNTNASLAYSLKNRAGVAHNLVRRAARALFPLRIRETGLQPALEELAACFNELYKTDFTVAVSGTLHSIPHETALQLYRICQETALAVVDRSPDVRIRIQAAVNNGWSTVSLRHDGPPLGSGIGGAETAQLINYRLRQIHGTVETAMDDFSSETLAYTVPITAGHPA